MLARSAVLTAPIAGARGLHALAPIGLDEINASAALQDRVDVKYIVTLAQLDTLLAHVAASHRALEIDGRRSFRYATTYYDTDDMITVREHVQRRRRRYKCRKRRYVDSGRSILEVKLKGPAGRTVKHAVPCRPCDVLDDEEDAFLRAQVHEAYGRRVDGPLRPTLTTNCRRWTIVAPELGERVTCDVELDFDDGSRLDAGLAIVESKSARGTAAADRALRAMGVRPVRSCSKYLIGMALTTDGVRDNDLRPLLRRFFTAAAV